ncbi:MAG: hypothetical protein IKF38_00645, partial [Clostridia bacterium]|nr:hypothetical protein [Clostridia bacterium]
AVAVIVILIIGFAVIKMVKNNNSWKEAKNADDIVIKDNDSNEVKAEKLQKKIELINADIEEIQLKLNPELEKLNELYEEYVTAMNENQGVVVTDEATEEEPAEEEPAEEDTTEDATAE